MNREEVAADVAAKHARRTEAVRRTIEQAPDTVSAREWLRAGILTLSGVSVDKDTITDIMSFVDQYTERREQGRTF
jgi:hypothetical protein